MNAIHIFASHVATLSARHARLSIRTPGLSWVLFLQHAAVSTVIGISASRLDITAATDARDTVGVVQVAILICFATALTAWDVVVDILEQTAHEVRSRKYTATEFFVSFFIVHSVRLALFSVVPAVVPTVYLAKLRDTPKAVWHCLASSYCCGVYGLVAMLLLVGVTTDLHAVSAWMLLPYFSCILNGRVRPVDDMPAPLRWFATRLGIAYFAIDAAVAPQFGEILDCGGPADPLVACPIPSREYLRTAHSYLRAPPRERYTRSVLILVIVAIVAGATITRRVFSFGGR